MSDDIDKWASEIVGKIVDAERRGGGFRLYHEQAAREIAESMRAGRAAQAELEQMKAAKKTGVIAADRITGSGSIDESIVVITGENPPSLTDDQLREMFAQHCECRDIDGVNLRRVESDHSHDCDTEILADIQCALFDADNQRRAEARARCAQIPLRRPGFWRNGSWHEVGT